MLTAGRRDLLLPERRGRLAALVVGGASLLYAWPLLAGGASTAASRADQLLQLAAVTAVGLACLSASWRHHGRTQAALLVLAAGAQVWACVQAVHLVQDLLGRSGPSSVMDAAGSLALSGSAAAALWLLRRPQHRPGALRVAAEWSLVAVSVLVLVRLALPWFWASGDPRADWARAVGISVLLAAALLTWVAPGSTDRSWPLLPGALLGLAAAQSLADASPAGLPPRLPGLLLAACLGVVALAVVLGGVPRPSTTRTGPVGPPPAVTGALCLVLLSAFAAVAFGGLTEGGLEPAGLGALVVLGLLSVAHGHLLGVEGRSGLRQLAETEQSLRHRAFHDDLTGLPNRALFLDRLTLALDLHRRHRLPVSVLYGDLDGFKHVNDRHGHAVGDVVLSQVAARLRQCLRPEDMLARLGGDEFVVLLEHASTAEVVADRLRAALLDPVTVDDLSFELRMSIGSARTEPQDPTPSPQEVLARADAAMYAAKAHAAAPAPREPEPAAALAAGLQAGNVFLVYQPVVDLATGVVHGAQALARWRHDGRVLLPEVFVELAERSGLSAALTEVVLEQACAQLGVWSAAVGDHRLTVSVTVPSAQIGDPTLAGRLRTAADRHGLRPGQVLLEATVAEVSGAAVQGTEGLHLSLGGFTGAPDEFALLSALPVRAVRLARPQWVGGDRLLHVLAALAAELDVRVVVEQVERPDELATLQQVSGVLAQGYLLSRPALPTALDEVVLHGCPLPV